jgi:hypothetical protein
VARLVHCGSKQYHHLCHRNPTALIPAYATADGGAIVRSMPTSGQATLYTLDQDGNVTSQTADTGAVSSWTGNWYADPLGTISQVSMPLLNLASSFWPFAGANPSAEYVSSFFTKEITVIGWVDKNAISVPPTTSVSPTLVSNLNANSDNCPFTLFNLNIGDRSIIANDIDRQYTNAFLLTNSANDEPPLTLDASVLKGGNFRAYNDVRAAINTKDNQIINVIFANPMPVLGHTPDACHSPTITFFNHIFNFEKPEAHPDNGKHGKTPSALKVFQIAEGRVGPGGQAVNMTLNSCTSTNPLTGNCNAPVPVPTKKSILIEAVEFMRLRCVLCQSHVYPFCLLTLLRASLLPNSGSFAS